MLNSHASKRAFKESIPVFFAYFPFGMIFGMFFVNHGFSWAVTTFISLYFYAGTVLFLILSFIDKNGYVGNVPALFLASFFVALRNVFYGLSFTKRFRNFRSWMKAYIIFALVDTSYVLMLNKEYANLQQDEIYCLGVCFWPHFFWFLGSFTGAILGHLTPVIPGIEFLLALLFAVMAFEKYLSKPRPTLVLITILFYACYRYCWPTYSFILTLLSMILVLSLWGNHPYLCPKAKKAEIALE